MVDYRYITVHFLEYGLTKKTQVLDLVVDAHVSDLAPGPVPLEVVADMPQDKTG
jgi:hypothetical protein